MLYKVKEMNYPEDEEKERKQLHILFKDYISIYRELKGKEGPNIVTF